MGIGGLARSSSGSVSSSLYDVAILSVCQTLSNTLTVDFRYILRLKRRRRERWWVDGGGKFGEVGEEEEHKKKAGDTLVNLTIPSAAFLMLKLPEMLRHLNSAPNSDGSPPKGAVFKGLRLFLSSTSLVDLADTKTQADTALLFLQVS